MLFQQHLIESLDIEKLKHLEHLEDHIFHGGHQGVQHASETLSDVVAALEGKTRKHFNQQTKITVKYDGAPSIVFGIDPRTDRFFVGTKSVFNKQPKAAYNDEDIEQMYSHSPGLIQKLKTALEQLPKIMPPTGGVFQGDIMYEKNDVKDDGKSYSFTPNTITYSVNKDSSIGRQINNANIGVVVHTKYTGKSLSDMKASFDVNQHLFKNDPEVHMINPEINQAAIKPIERKVYQSHIDNAIKVYSALPDDVFNIADGHDQLIKIYVNTCVRDQTQPSANGYLSFVKQRNKKEIEQLKTPAGKQKRKQKAAVIESHIKNHIDSFDAIFKIHDNLQKAKDVVVQALSRVDTGFKTTIGGKPTKPEGFVAIRGGKPSKLVDRSDFSAANFAVGAFRKGAKEEQAAAEDLKPIVTSFGRMNPPTYHGHGAVVGKVNEIAKELKAPSVIALTRTQDPENNPLTPEQKLKHAKRMFPGANIVIADEDARTIIQHVKKLSEKGHKHLVLVVGSDRVEEMKQLLDKYNGQEYKFKKIDVVSSGERDMDTHTDDDDIKNKTSEQIRRGMSASKLRAHAIKGHFTQFRQGLPPDMPEHHAREMYNETRAGMDIKIGPDTPIRALINHARRKDPIGVKARRELQRREQQKQVREETIGGGDGSIGGLGFNTGNPATTSPAVANYVAQNTADSDQRNNILKSIIKNYHDKYHNNIFNNGAMKNGRKI